MATTLHVSKPDKQRKYDDAFKTEALRLAGESRSTRTAARKCARCAPGCSGCSASGTS